MVSTPFATETASVVLTASRCEPVSAVHFAGSRPLPSNSSCHWSWYPGSGGGGVPVGEVGAGLVVGPGMGGGSGDACGDDCCFSGGMRPHPVASATTVARNSERQTDKAILPGVARP